MYWEVVGNHIWRVQKASQIPPPPDQKGSNGCHKIADFDILPYISFITAFRAWETLCEEPR